MNEPLRLTPFQKRVLLVLAFAIAATRFLAAAATFFDWDEALFSLAVGDYDVAAHRPHPPGYPLFVAAGKMAHLFVDDEFRALQVVVVAAALFVFPAVFFFAREAGFDFATAAAGATIFAFFHNVWLYGGTAFSDIPGTVVGLAACALLLRGRRHRRAFLFGAVLLGVAAGVRPSNLLIGMVPALMATWTHLRAGSWRLAATAMALGAATVTLVYAGAALSSENVAAYVDIVQTQSEYVRKIDSWRNPVRGPLRDAAITFWIRPFRAGDLLDAVAILAACSIAFSAVRRRKAPLLTLALFAPLALTSWLNFDINAASRYAIGYMAAHALLAADGLLVLLRLRWLQVAACSALTGILVVKAQPMLLEQRTAEAPAVAALRYVAAKANPGAPVHVHGSLAPHAYFLLPDRPVHLFERADEIPATGDVWFVDWRLHPGAMQFVRPRTGTWNVLRQRGFEASAGTAYPAPQYIRGWYPEEDDHGRTWRWMGREGVVRLPAAGEKARLFIEMTVPSEVVAQHSVIELTIDGVVLDRVVMQQESAERSWVVPSRRGEPHELRISTTRTVVPAQSSGGADSRELGVKVGQLSWTPLS